eukprot:gb/GEZN01015344.1/.p1 GENE.gb/GEZN01015344.1/~~gb/GEZN01015344.1/.p1  ORF type:complete len:232 (-),score=26.94 gb/GEZN01015344.1/:175-870(-)
MGASLSRSEGTGKRDVRTRKPLLKMVMLGHQTVGKSEFFNSYRGKGDAWRETVGVDFLDKVITIGGKKVRLQLHDTAGQEFYRAIPVSYARQAAAAVVMYTLVDHGAAGPHPGIATESFKRAESWIQELHKNHEYKKFDVLLIGNKLDLVEDKVMPRVIETEAGKDLAAKYTSEDMAITYQELCSKNIDTVTQCVQNVLEQLVKRRQDVLNPAESKAVDPGSRQRTGCILQ